MLKLTSIVVGGLAAAGVLFAAHQASAQPGGSYQQSCTHIVQRGPNLYAMCKNVQGEWTRTGINASSCRGPIANSNGRLTCAGGGAPAYQPQRRHYDRRDEHRDRRDRDHEDRDHRDRRDSGRDQRVSPDQGSPGYGRPPY